MSRRLSQQKSEFSRIRRNNRLAGWMLGLTMAASLGFVLIVDPAGAFETLELFFWQLPKALADAWWPFN